jgi:hypothetical protein
MSRVVKMFFDVGDDFKIGDCSNCPLNEYGDEYGGKACHEGNCYRNENCPLEEALSEGDFDE